MNQDEQMLSDLQKTMTLAYLKNLIIIVLVLGSAACYLGLMATAMNHIPDFVNHVMGINPNDQAH